MPLHPNNKWKAEQTEESTTLLVFLRDRRTWGKQVLPKLQRQIREKTEWGLTRAETQEQTSPQEPVRGQENLKCNWQIAESSVWTTLTVKKLHADPVMEREVHSIIRFISGSLPRDPRWKKTCLLLPAWGEGKEPFWNTLEHPGLLSKASPQGKLITCNLTCWGIISA